MTTIERGHATRVAEAYEGMVTGTVEAGFPAVALAANSTPVMGGVLVQNSHTSTNYVTVGNNWNQFVEIAPGGHITIPTIDLSQVFVGAAGGATVNWIAMT